MKKILKFYSYSTNIFIFVFLILLFIGFLIPLIIIPNKSWGLIIPMLVIIIYIYYSIHVGMLRPIYLSDEGIAYKNKKYSWDDLRITAYPIMGRSIVNGYILLFGKKYLSHKEIKEAKRQTFYIYLKAKPLKEILMFYNKEILILDSIGNKDNLRSTKKLNFLINEHNKKVHSYTTD